MLKRHFKPINQSSVLTGTIASRLIAPCTAATLQRANVRADTVAIAGGAGSDYKC